MPGNRRIALSAWLLVAGCSSFWTLAEGDTALVKHGFRIIPPRGWSYHSFDEVLVITRDGVGLQRILVARWPIDSGFNFTQRKITDGNTMLERAEVVRDDLQSIPGTTRFSVNDISPARIAGMDGFRLYYSSQNRDGLEWKGIVYGVMHRRNMYLLRFEGFETFYFGRDSVEFEHTVGSFGLAEE